MDIWALLARHVLYIDQSGCSILSLSIIKEWCNEDKNVGLMCESILPLLAHCSFIDFLVKQLTHFRLSSPDRTHCSSADLVAN